ncbi:NYN domain-containing protein [Candidatus Leptofilum sp.]|uniref:NYN domain-containing protein n=1 Tax=Candidatus Leptofilum sp. TaxID=3241576 RepID=UPI003B59FF45
MHYLIDGHNLIAKLPDIDLSDPDDEIQLILKLRQWTAVSAKRVVTVYFDGGIPGGHNVNLSNSQVKVIFVRQGKTADSLIIARINRVNNPPEFRLVTSDQEIINAAKKRKMPHIRSEQFAHRLNDDKEERILPGPTITDEDPVISDAEVSEWLDLFGPVDENALRNRPKPIPPNRLIPEPEPEPEEAEAIPKPPASSDRENPELSDEELLEWLTLFGGEPKQEPQSINKPTTETKKAKPRPQKKKKSPNPHNLSDKDLDAWNAYFGQDD